MTSSDRLPVIVVGAGLAGLTCARLLAQTGTPIVVLEAADGIGGRVRTDVTPEGFVLDRGFQVVFTAYPALRRVLDLRTLDLRPFDNGAAIVTAGGPVLLRDPVRHPEYALGAITAPLLTWGDRARLAQLAISLAAAHWDGVRDVPDTGRSVEQELRVLGFSDQLIEAFFRPFLAGIRLRRDLSTSAAVGLFDLKMLVSGRAALPARGMQALPEALAADLLSGAIRLDTPVLELLRDEDRQVLGVRTPHGEMRGSAVVLAADGASTARLTGLDLPRIGLGSVTLYLAGRQRPYSQKLLALNALPDAFVNDATLLTNIVPEYAPPGWHLLAAHVLDPDGLDDGIVEARARADLAASGAAARVQHLVPSIGLLDRGSALDNPELRQFFARAAPDRQEVRAELRQHVRLPTAAIAQLWRLSIGSGAAARRVRVPTLNLQGLADRVVWPHDTRVLGGRLGGPFQLHELAAGHLLLDPAGSAWDLVRELIVSFVRP